MLTLRSSLILATSTWLFVMSILIRYEALSLVCLSVLFWVWFEWICFRRRVRLSAEGWQGLIRRVDGSSDAQVTLVTEQVVEIHLSGRLPACTRGYRLLIRDSIPDAFQRESGGASLVLDSVGQVSFEVNDVVRIPMGGRFSLPGFRVEYSDFCGLFRKEQFIALEQSLTVLPFLIRPQTTVSVLKHNNLQRHLGHHRHRSAGISSELHGIRDYRIGDPPRTMAWKPTARLGKPMTCEFESEVPIRATILVDLSGPMFAGRPGRSPADRAITASASVAKLLLADRDPVAATLLTDSGMRRLNHGSGERQMGRILQHLLACSNPNPPLEHLTIEELVQVVFENGSRRFPDLFDERFNSGPVRSTLNLWQVLGSPRSRRALAVVLEYLFDLSPGHSTRLQYDDEAMRRMCVRYVDRYSLFADATSLRLTRSRSDPGRQREMRQLLCDQLLESRMRAKDNELFVLIASEPKDREGLKAILDAVRITVAARHRVIFVSAEFIQRHHEVQDSVAARILEQAALTERNNRKSDLRDGLGSLGASFARIDDPALMQMVAMEIGLLQSGNTRGKVLTTR